MKLLSYSTLFALPFFPYTLAARCPITGPLLPTPKHLAASPLVSAAGEKLKNLYDSAVSGSIVSGWQTNATSFSIILTDATGASLWEYHHTAPGNVNNTGNVNGDTQYMIASVTKVFTDLALLKLGLNLDDPITKYLPELACNDSPIQWKDITLGALGDHLADIPQTYGFPDDYTTNPYLEQIGFPKLSKSDYPICGVNGLNGACTKQQLLAGLSKSRPIFPPFSRPAYSSISFTLLGYVLEQVTGKTYVEVIETEILKPLGMKNTGFQPINSTSGVIPPVMNVWGATFGDNNPGSGLYSTANDLTLLLKGILSLSILPTPSRVREWLKPRSETASLYSLVGMPWEIIRAANLTPAHPHVTDIYTKDGHVPGYTARIAAISEYGVGFTLLTTGDFQSINIITEAFLSTLTPAIEEATREEAKAYIGNFSTLANSTIKSHLVLTIDGGPGLKITEFFSNSSNMLDRYFKLWTLWPGSSGGSQLDFRIYPAGISEASSSNGTSSTARGLIKEDWRLEMEPVPDPSTSQLPSQKVYDSICSTWQGYDTLYYGGKPMDRFVFLKKGDEVVGVEIPFLRVTLMK